MDPKHPAPQPHGSPDGPFPLSGTGYTRVIAIRPGQRPDSLPQELAQLLLTTYTNIVDVVVDLDDDASFAAAAAATGRRHYAAGDHDPADVADAAGCARLVLLNWPRPPGDPRLLLQGCADLLSPSGHLAIAIRVEPRQRTAHLTALVGAARAAHLRLVGHGVALATGSPAAPPTAVPSSVPGGKQPDPSKPPPGTASPHTDLLILRPSAGGHG